MAKSPPSRETSPPTQATDAPPAGRRPLWKRRRVAFAGIAAVLVVAGAVAAAIIIQQDAAISSTSQVSDVQFVDGGGGLAGFATMTTGTDGASASITLTPVSGASLQVSGMLQIQNTDASQAYSVSLSQSAAPDAGITALTFTVFDDLGAQVDQYDAVADSGSGFSLPASKTYDIRIDMTIADGSGTASLGSFDLQFSLTPA